MRRFILFLIIAAIALSLFWRWSESTAEDAPSATLAGRGSATVIADVVALDGLLVYNRFGSFNPFGMIYALREDVAPIDAPVSFADAKKCETLEAEHDSRASAGGALAPGKVRLRDCKRPRPLTLRVNVGDTLEIHFQNLLADDQPDVSKNFCPESFRNPPDGADNLNDKIWKDEFPTGAVPGRHHCNKKNDGDQDAEATNWPKTRRANFAIAGLKLAADQFPRRQPSDPIDAERFDPDICLGVSSAPTGGRVVCRYEISHEGPFFASSSAAPAGGEGDGGSLTHGLFAAVIAEPKGSAWYRSQVTREVFDAVWKREHAVPHARAGALDYEARDPASGLPYLNMLRPEAIAGRPTLFHWDAHQPSKPEASLLRLVHADLNAIVREPEKDASGAPTGAYAPFREFTVVLHDELKTFYTNAYRLLGGVDGNFSQLAGVRDGFGVNYGAGGMGPMLIANRKGIGPAAYCVECLYEEFFLQSWANGDPALLEHFPDDPSNVHHSYLNDRIVFRNFHAGPKETHVFHLHAHQWFAGNDSGRGSYLDSQTVGPQQGFTYRIYNGGLKDYDDEPAGWRDGKGSGNRNRTPGDSIFHCHLYPHFAQGMWELWRVHDVLEDGSRKLPDGQHEPGLSLEPAQNRKARAGTPLDAASEEAILQADGTPIPALVPLPDEPAPLLPTYGAKGMPGYPFYIAGQPGRRAPQPPLDMATDAKGKPLDGGLPRHVVESGERIFAAEEHVSPAPDKDALLARALAIGDLTAHFEKLGLRLLDPRGHGVERNGMAFHHDGALRDDAGGAAQKLDLRQANGASTQFDAGKGGYATFTLTAPSASGAAQPAASGWFYVNGAPPAPGAPFADPCGAPDGFPDLRSAPDPFTFDGAKFTLDPGVRGFRRYDVSAVQLKDMIVNKAGWHDPQARIDVLSREAGQYKDKIRADATPFFFRARSGECIEFRHTNELPKDLERDDFQVATPTDTIGQHIHLVKFDVTASDGSGNGWNYEDGTFAPDEVNARICASLPGVGSVTGVGKTEQYGRLCDKEKDDYWKESRDAHPEWFQTTVQRWFADPILSKWTVNAKKPDDRTLRTVFSHDHFGPSSIQQHGFYTALVIEPSDATICPEHVDERSKDKCDKSYMKPDEADARLWIGDEKLVGPRKLVLNRPPHDDDMERKEGAAKGGKDHWRSSEQDAREYALAVADFALLYDPRAASGKEQYAKEKPAKGLVCLAREAEAHAAEKTELKSICSGRGDMDPGSSPIVRARYNAKDRTSVAQMLVEAARTLRDKHGRPIAAPDRPESISVDHHDPYLVNYRNEPPALRVGATKADTSEGLSLAPCGDPGAAKRGSERSIAFQRKGDAGDLGFAFRSILLTGADAGRAHGDPCTPILDAYDNELIQIRLIQGAQEVQHVFTIEGLTLPRNYDQAYPSRRDFTTQSDEAIANPTWQRKCHESRAATAGERDAGADYARLIAVCDNVEGRHTGQEIGISEHFEFNAPFRREGVVQTPLLLEELERRRREPGIERAKPLVEDLFTDPVFANRVTAVDYLYHFGTLDALWNGAWGLLRVHEAPSASRFAYDIGDCLKALSDSQTTTRDCIKNLRKPTHERLTPLAQARAIAHDQSAAPFDNDLADARKSMSEKERKLREATRSVGARPAPRFSVACPLGAPLARATAVAVEARDLNSKGIVYHPQAPELRDPDGRLLALIASFDKNEDPIGAVKHALSGASSGETPNERIRPFVLRVNAGDCLDLTLVNALSKNPADEPGDALMPKITPLNVDTHDGWDLENGVFLEGDPSKKGSNARPSSKLALSIPLTATSNQFGAPAPVGVSAGEALAPGETAHVFYYAGTLKPNFFVAVDRALLNQAFCAGEGLGTARLRRYDPASHAPDASIIDVFGRWYVLEGVEGAPEQHRGKLEKCISAAIAQDPEGGHAFTPYAFGALPVKPLGDTFNQTPHGLFGAIVVEPKGACYPGRKQAGFCVDGAVVGAASAEPVEIIPSQMKESAYIRLTEGFTDGPQQISPPSAPLREHVLFWQDGLNLRAQNSDGEKPVADCHVCDDTYDFGKKGVSYRSTALFARLDLRGERPYQDRSKTLNGAADLNAVDLPADLLHVRGAGANRTPIVLDAKAGEQAWLRLVHPGGRARQRAFVLTGAGYDDLFPGFGFPNAALLAPGKALTAATRRPLGPGCHLWRDGPQTMVGGGVWGLLEVTDENGNGACPVSPQQASPH